MSASRKIKALSFVDWFFSFDTKPFEIWSAAFAFFLGGSFLSAADLASVSGAVNMVGIDIDFVGAALVLGSLIQGLGLSLYFVAFIQASRVLRWFGSCLEGAAWAVCAVYVTLTPGLPNELVWVYALLLLQEVWVIMTLAYRGAYAGRNG